MQGDVFDGSDSEVGYCEEMLRWSLQQKETASLVKPGNNWCGDY